MTIDLAKMLGNSFVQLEQKKKRKPPSPLPKGEKHNRSKLTEPQVRAIFFDIRPRRLIAEQYGVTLECIKSIQCGHTWKHLNLKGEKK